MTNAFVLKTPFVSSSCLSLSQLHSLSKCWVSTTCTDHDSGRSGISSTVRTPCLLSTKGSFRKVRLESSNIKAQSSFTTACRHRRGNPTKAPWTGCRTTADEGCCPCFMEQTAGPESIWNNLSPHCYSTLLTSTASLPTGNSMAPFAVRWGQNTTTSEDCLSWTESQGRERSHIHCGRFPVSKGAVWFCFCTCCKSTHALEMHCSLFSLHWEPLYAGCKAEWD